MQLIISEIASYMYCYSYCTLLSFDSPMQSDRYKSIIDRSRVRDRVRDRSRVIGIGLGLDR